MSSTNTVLTGRNGLYAAGAALAALAFNQVSSRRAEHRYPPVGRILDVDGVAVHVLERGSGDPVVLIHGSGSLIQDFMTSGLVDRLAESRRVIVFDRPGYGYSARPRGTVWTPERQAALLVAACAQIGVERPVVMGHSWGTLVALAWALDHPEKLSRLVLASGYFFPTMRPDAVPTTIAGMPIIGDLISHTIAPIQTRLTGPFGNRMVFSPARPPQRFLDYMPFGLILRPQQLRATAADSGQMPAAAARLAKRYGELKLPVTILWGEGDKLVDQSIQSARLLRELSQAVGLEIAGGGHMIHHVRPDLVTNAILAPGLPVPA
ncbi:alpha/beta fold hydrolase [Sphingomonas radiodurans]|uniref:alpha/beta fold hydrolase n=1 Tax=Sphingomonas radiodurans TaxID=2890321 RepID=UPI001E5A53EA|nr:alpha/beta hydrolase [Sphingomonas radiodurans]WBH15552.1 alpha/beta hydrolase [Sphingomonas radiodurans]